jgi:prepilin-type N-terminal cleavage/methylation domain-containing protein
LSKASGKGMTLVEVLVAMVMVGIVVAAVIATFQVGAIISRNLDLIYTGTYLAERRIELLKRFSFESLDVYGENYVRIGGDGNIAADGKYLRSTEITKPYDGNPYLAKVKVTISRAKIRSDGGIVSPDTSQPTLLGQPIVMETLFADVE